MCLCVWFGGEVRRLQDSETHLLLLVTNLLSHTLQSHISTGRGHAPLCVSADLLFPVEDADDDEDKDTHSDQRDGRQQHAVARSEVQLSSPATNRRRAIKK